MSATQEFTSPEIHRDDYYERLGAPKSADASDIDDYTKKYVAEFKPELSSHENADERWKRFNKARQTLNSPDSKENYDTFRERFGSDQAAEAYETWQARDAIGDPNSVSASDLGLESEVDESESRQDSRDRDRSERRSSSREQRKQRSTREERRRERERRRREGETDIDTDSSKTYSTRATGESDGSDTATDADTDTADSTEASTSGTVGRVIDHVRSTVDLAATEVSTMLSLLDLVLVAYLFYVLVVEFVIGSVPVPTVRDAGTVVIGLGVVGLLSWEYLDRFGERLAAGGATSIGNQFTRSARPARLLSFPVVFAALWSLVLLAGGAALTILLLAVSVVSEYGRLRGIRSVAELPDWAEYVEPAGGVIAAIVFVALFVQSGQTPGLTAPLATADIPILAGVGVALLALIGAPIAAVHQHLSG